MDDIIKFDTAKLAYEKKFDWSCFHYFTLDGKLHEPYLENGSSTDTDFRVDLEDLRDTRNSASASSQNFYAAPQQSTLQKWLREVHKINVEGNYLPNIQKYGQLHIPMTGKAKRSDIQYVGREFYDSYEEALEKGLKEALKLIEMTSTLK